MGIFSPEHLLFLDFFQLFLYSVNVVYEVLANILSSSLFVKVMTVGLP